MRQDLFTKVLDTLTGGVQRKWHLRISLQNEGVSSEYRLVFFDQARKRSSNPNPSGPRYLPVGWGSSS